MNYNDLRSNPKNMSINDFNRQFMEKQQQKNNPPPPPPLPDYITPDINPYLNPHLNFNQDSPNRAACLVVVDKHRKKFASVFKKIGSYDIPGGKTKLIESFEDAARRELFEETGLTVDPRNMHKLLDAFDGQFRVVTFVSFSHKGKLQTNENHYVSWVPLEYLKVNENPRWKKYNSIIYQKILPRMY